MIVDESMAVFDVVFGHFTGLTASASTGRRDGLLASQLFFSTPATVERIGSVFP